MSAERSSESRQGHEQPGANSDTVEYESRQRSGQPGSERDIERLDMRPGTDPEGKQDPQRTLNTAKSEHLLVYYIRFCKGHKEFTCY